MQLRICTGNIFWRSICTEIVRYDIIYLILIKWNIREIIGSIGFSKN